MDRLTPTNLRRLFTLTATAVVLITGTASAAPQHAAAKLRATSVGDCVTTSRPTAANKPEPCRTGADSDDPLAGGSWGVNEQSSDAGLWAAYASATGTDKTLLGRAARQPRNLWFHSGISSSDIASKVQTYISKTQAGDPNVLVPMAFFRLWPHHESGKNIALTSADQAAYKSYMANAAAAIGDSRTAVILEPDLPVSLSGWEPSVRAKLTKYAAGRLGALKNTATYLDAGDSDWLSVSAATKLLISAGIKQPGIRGFALGPTHYTKTPADLTYGQQLVTSLLQAGVPSSNVHFVIDTADNGKGFTFSQYRKRHPNGNHDNAAPCTSTTDTVCDTLGIPPTPITWGIKGMSLSSAQKTTAQTYADGYLWIGRPWLDNQAAPFDAKRTIAVARYTPFQ